MSSYVELLPVVGAPGRLFPAFDRRDDATSERLLRVAKMLSAGACGEDGMWLGDRLAELLEKAPPLDQRNGAVRRLAAMIAPGLSRRQQALMLQAEFGRYLRRWQRIDCMREQMPPEYRGTAHELLYEVCRAAGRRGMPRSLKQFARILATD